MSKEYKLRLPVLQRSCANCGLDYKQHVDGKCLFEASGYKPGEIKVVRQTVHANVVTTSYCCGRTQSGWCYKCGREFNPS